MDCFLTLQNQLFEQLNSLWESDDEEILEKIDELLLQEGSNYGLSLNEKPILEKNYFAPSENSMCFKNFSKIPALPKLW